MQGRQCPVLKDEPRPEGGTDSFDSTAAAGWLCVCAFVQHGRSRVQMLAAC